ncbi:MAG: tetratricopeptide repeat protein [Anaerolineae bacterium]|nr:tetratricopeptide repeat protein [Anaerolineae bacterium]
MSQIQIDPYLLLLLIACLYILVFGGLGLVRREGLSIQFVVESVLLTALVVGGGWLLGLAANPFFFLVLLYLVTLRSRLLTDFGNVLARRRSYDAAFRVYDLALALWPDSASRLIVLANLGAARLHSGQVEAAIETMKEVLSETARPGLGIKYEAATHYNLGYAYEKSGDEARAVVEYNEAIDTLPGSLYAQAAQSALKRRKQQA